MAAKHTEQVATRVSGDTASALQEWAEREDRSVASLTRMILTTAAEQELKRMARIAERRAS